MVDRQNIDSTATLQTSIAADAIELTAFQGPLFRLYSLPPGLLGSIAGILATLPDNAFELQPDDVDGRDVWSAGEIIGRLAEMEPFATLTGNQC